MLRNEPFEGYNHFYKVKFLEPSILELWLFKMNYFLFSISDFSAVIEHSGIYYYKQLSFCPVLHLDFEISLVN